MKNIIYFLHETMVNYIYEQHLISNFHFKDIIILS